VRAKETEISAEVWALWLGKNFLLLVIKNAINVPIYKTLKTVKRGKKI